MVDKDIYETIKNDYTLDEATKIYSEAYLRNSNNEECSEEFILEHGKAIIILEYLGKLEEVRTELDNKLVETEEGKYRYD